MGKSTRATILTLSNTYLGNCTNFTEELVNSIFTSSETQITNEKSVLFTSSSRLWLITREFNAHGATTEIVSILSSNSLDSRLVSIVFNKGNTLELSLAHNQFDLDKVSMLGEMVSQSIFINIIRKRFDKKFGLFRVLRVRGSSFFLGLFLNN